MDEYYVLTFQNTHEAMNAEKFAKDNKIQIQVIPTPTYITKSCGISLKFKEESVNEIKQLISSKKISVKNMYFKKQEEVINIM
ncbi:DUF3343 domain-containing protein [Haloimpatiens sp. FM7315]|uniref:DUF3343 domain-containing protein n=1 Tax=Haloimpatiens sp. FM7315 TaxID=3298609 RepID=UPI0035A32368